MHAPPGINFCLIVLVTHVHEEYIATIYYNTNIWVQEEGDCVSSHVESEAEDNV